MLHRGDPLPHVLVCAFGADSAGRVWIERMSQLLEQIPTVALRRRVLGHFLRLFAGARRHGSQWRVVDESGYVGRQVERRDRVVEQLDPVTGEVTHEILEVGDHVPGDSAGGMAAREHRCPRTLIEWRARLRDAQPHPEPIGKRGRDRRRPSGELAVMRSCQPKPTDRGAVVPRREGACFAYAQHWLTLPPSAAMLEQWGARPDGRASAAPRIGSAELPRLPGEPEALRDVLERVRRANAEADA